MNAKRKVGRPRNKVSRPVLAFRVREPLYRAIEKLATKSGRSLSAETEQLLEGAVFGRRAD